MQKPPLYILMATNCPKRTDHSAVIKTSNRFEILDSPYTEIGSTAGPLSDHVCSVKPPAIHILVPPISIHLHVHCLLLLPSNLASVMERNIFVFRRIRKQISINSRLIVFNPTSTSNLSQTFLKRTSLIKSTFGNYLMTRTLKTFNRISWTGTSRYYQLSKCTDRTKLHIRKSICRYFWSPYSETSLYRNYISGIPVPL